MARWVLQVEEFWTRFMDKMGLHVLNKGWNSLGEGQYVQRHGVNQP